MCCVDPALQPQIVTLLTKAQASCLETNISGREVTAVPIERDGNQETYSADIVVSCGAIKLAALLLRSASWPARPITSSASATRCASACHVWHVTR